MEMTISRPGGRGGSANEKGYSAAYFAQKHRISLPIARALIEQFGDDRAALNEAARQSRKV